MKNLYKFGSTILIVLFLSACSSKVPQSNSIIKDPSILKPVPNKENVFYYINKGFDANQYNKVEIPKIIINGTEEDKTKIDTKLFQSISKYLENGLEKELTSVLSNNSVSNTLIMNIGISSFDVAYQPLKPWQYLPFGLAIKAIGRGTDLEKRKLYITQVIKILDKKTNTTQIMIVDNKVKDDMPKYEELTFNNVKPLLDYWIKNSKEKLQELNDHKYKY